MQAAHAQHLKNGYVQTHLQQFSNLDSIFNNDDENDERPLIFLTKGLLLKLLFKLILIIIEESEGENSLNDFEKSRALAIIYVWTNLANFICTFRSTV